MLASDVAPCFNLDVRPGACHPISRRKADQGARRLEPQRRKLSGHDGERWSGTMKKLRGAGGKGDERMRQEKYGSVC
jgi:hypothetical protein